MSWLSRLLRRGPSQEETELGLAALKAIRGLVGDAKTALQARDRIAAGARKGDLDDVVGLLLQSDAKVADFIKNG